MLRHRRPEGLRRLQDCSCDQIQAAHIVNRAAVAGDGYEGQQEAKHASQESEGREAELLHSRSRIAQNVLKGQLIGYVVHSLGLIVYIVLSSGLDYDRRQTFA